MPEKTIAGYTVNVDEEGFMTHPDEWNEDIAREIAKQEGISELTDRHWDAINFIRKDFKEKGAPPTIRRMTKVGGVPTKEMYSLFPDGPAKKAAKISGLGKPQGCV